MNINFSLPNLDNLQWLGFFIALFCSLGLTPLVKNYAIKLNILSEGGGRHIHKDPIPRLGGLSIYLSVLITSLFFVILYGRYTPAGAIHFELLGILIGGTLIFILGLLDDLSPIKAKIKLIVQIFSSIVAWFCGVKIKYLVNPLFYAGFSDNRVWELDPILSFLFTVGWLILITNALNLIDGLDGLAGGVALISSLSLWALFMDPKIIQPAGALLVATIAGSVLGFLRLNFNPAQIFMGDSGAYFLGFTLGATAISGLSENPNTSTVGSVIVLVFLFPLVDTLFAIVRRLIQGKPLMKPDADHIHHRLLHTGLSAKATMLVIFVTCLLLGFFVATLTGNQLRYLILALLTLSIASLSFFWKRNKKENIKESTKNEKSN